jgi:hypothetical protein
VSKLLEDGKDFANVALQGRKGPVGTLKVSLIALDALKALDGPVGVASAAATQIGPRLPATRIHRLVDRWCLISIVTDCM